MLDVPGGGPGFGTASGGGGGGRLRKFPCCFVGAGGGCRCRRWGGGGGGGGLRGLGGGWGDLWCGGVGYLKVRSFLIFVPKIAILTFPKGPTSTPSQFTFALGADEEVDPAGKNTGAAG